MSDATTVPRQFLLTGAVLAVVGIALASAGRPTLGGLISVAGMSLLIAGLHPFGRAGPER